MPPPPSSHQRTSNASSWWERSIVKRSTQTIQNMVDTMMEDAYFLQRHANDDRNSNVLLLQRSNVQIGQILGRGSFSVVSEVRGLMEEREPEHDCTFGVAASLSTLDRHALQDVEGRYAIKHLRPDLVQKPDMFQAAAADLLLEAKYLAALDHPGILKLRAMADGGVSAFQATGGLYDGFFLVTDRLQGTLRDKILEWQVLQQEESLLECLPSSSSSFEESKQEEDIRGPLLGERLLLVKLDIAQQMASALQYMHDRRLIFRDLKPPNVGLTADNRVQLFDFGFCRELPWWGGDYQPAEAPPVQVPEGQDDGDDALYYMSGKGSLMYLAPEVLHNGRYNRKADCYSFSMVLYETLTLNKPFHSVGNIEVFRELLCRHKARPHLEYSDVPPQLQDLIKHSWDDNIRQRWSMGKIRERLQEIAQELDPSASSSHGQDQHQRSDSANCGTGGFVLELMKGFAQDVQLGYEILLGADKNKILELQDPHQDRDPTLPIAVKIQPQASFQYRDALDEAEVTAADTATTEASSIFSTDTNHTLKITAMTATDEPLEVTLEEVMSMSGWSHDEYHPEEENPTDYTAITPCSTQVEDERGMEELRCPPSPPLERTSSAPLEHPNAKVHLKHNYQQRRQSTGNFEGGFYNLPEDLSPHYPPQRRQSTGGTGFFFSQEHFLPSPVELRG